MCVKSGDVEATATVAPLLNEFCGGIEIEVNPNYQISSMRAYFYCVGPSIVSHKVNTNHMRGELV